MTFSIIDLDARDFVRDENGKPKEFETYELAEDFAIEQEEIQNVQYFDWDGDGD